MHLCSKHESSRRGISNTSTARSHMVQTFTPLYIDAPIEVQTLYMTAKSDVNSSREQPFSRYFRPSEWPSAAVVIHVAVVNTLQEPFSRSKHQHTEWRLLSTYDGVSSFHGHLLSGRYFWHSKLSLSATASHVFVNHSYFFFQAHTRQSSCPILVAISQKFKSDDSLRSYQSSTTLQKTENSRLSRISNSFSDWYWAILLQLHCKDKISLQREDSGVDMLNYNVLSENLYHTKTKSLFFPSSKVSISVTWTWSLIITERL